MATIVKRTTSGGPVSYQVKVRIKGFAPESASFERLTDAKTWGKKIESDMKAGRHFGLGSRHTFNDLVDEYKDHAIDPVRLYHWRGGIRPGCA